MGRAAEYPQIREGLVLVLDDEALIALDIADSVADSGRDVLGPAFTLDEARSLLADKTPQLAVLDINIGQDVVWPLARELRDRGTKLLFVSGDLSPGNRCDDFRDASALPKPAMPEEIAAALETLEQSATSEPTSAAIEAEDAAPRQHASHGTS